MSATLRPVSAGFRAITCFCTSARIASVVGQTSGQCVNPKNTSVGWPRSVAAVAGAPCVSMRLKSASTLGAGRKVPDSSAGASAARLRRATYAPAPAAAIAMTAMIIQ